MTAGKKQPPGRFVLTLFWAYPQRSPPPGYEQVEWGVCGWNRADEAWLRTHAPSWAVPGCGYAHGWTPILPPPRRLPPDTTGRLRRTSLRRRLEARLPLLADVLEQAELTRRPGYFRGE